MHLTIAKRNYLNQGLGIIGENINNGIVLVIQQISYIYIVEYIYFLERVAFTNLMHLLP